MKTTKSNNPDALLSVNGIDYRFVYAPKCAWTSIRMYFISQEHLDFRWEQNIPNEIKKFTVLRSPFERFTSQFKEIVLKNSNYDPNTPNYYQIIDSIRNGSQSQMAGRFVDAVERHGMFDHHLISQADSITDPRRGRQNLSEDSIDCFADINNLNDRLSEFFGIDILLPRENVGRQLDKALFEPYRDRIESLFAEDVKLYERHYK